MIFVLSQIIRQPMLLLLLTLSVSTVNATQVNVNLATSYEIADSLHIQQRLAEKISIHCQYMTCRKPEDLLVLQDIDETVLNKIRAELLFSIMEGQVSDIDDC